MSILLSFSAAGINSLSFLLLLFVRVRKTRGRAFAVPEWQKQPMGSAAAA